MPAQSLASLLNAAPRPQMVDVALVGPAPRPLDSRLEAYVDKEVRSFAALWLVLALFGVAGNDINFITTGGQFNPPLFALIFGGLAFWSFRSRSHDRARLRETLRNGHLMRLEIVRMRAVEHRGRWGRVQYVDYYVTFATPAGAQTLKTRDPGVSLLQVGISEEVVWTESQPDVIVPTILLV